jgi:group I intron endonuclease
MKVIHIYRIINSISGMVYVGQTTNPYKRWYNHRSFKTKKSKLSEAIVEFGIENFKMEVLVETYSQCEADSLESSYIKENNSLWPNGYNINPHRLSQSHSVKLSKSIKQKGRKLSDESKRKISEAKTGIGRSEETKKKLSEALKGNQIWLGRKHSEESKRKMSLKMVGRKRKPFTEEHKRKISEARKRLHASK